jgi:predicted peptidase
MRRAAALLLLVAACSPPLQTETFLAGRFAVPPELVSEVSEEMRYLLWFPAGYEAGDDLALVVFLHGSGDDDYDSRWLTSHGLPAVLLFEGLPADRPFVLLAPQAAPGTSWDVADQPEKVMALVDDVIGRYGLDPTRVSLTGLSMGGYGAWHLATRYPDRFAAVASVSGSGYGRLELPDDLDVCALVDVDIRAYHGSTDLVSLTELNQLVIESWEDRCGAELDFTVIDGLGHFETFDQVYRDASFYEWLVRG